MVEKNGRTTLNLHAEGNSMLTENERNIVLAGQPQRDDRRTTFAARSLLPSKRDIRASGTIQPPAYSAMFRGP